MNAILEQINSASLKFVEFALPMFIQSVVLIVILLLADFVLRKKVRAVFRYWIWLLVLVKLVLPTSLSSPMSLGYFFGDSLTYVDTNEAPAEPQANLVEPEPVNFPPFVDIADMQADRFTQTAPPPPLISVPEQAKEPAVAAAEIQNRLRQVVVRVGGVFPRPPERERRGMRVETTHGFVPPKDGTGRNRRHLHAGNSWLRA